MNKLSDLIAQDLLNLDGINKTEGRTEFQSFPLVIESISNSKRVGMAVMADQRNVFYLRLYTFVNERFYLIPTKEDLKKYTLFTREPNKSPNSKNKYRWNIIGRAEVMPSMAQIKIEFDLLHAPIFLKLEMSEDNLKSIDPYAA